MNPNATNFKGRRRRRDQGGAPEPAPALRQGGPCGASPRSACYRIEECRLPRSGERQPDAPEPSMTRTPLRRHGGPRGNGRADAPDGDQRSKIWRIFWWSDPKRLCRKQCASQPSCHARGTG